jgi:hypothetical protein
MRLAIGLGLNVALGSGVALAQAQGWSNILPGAAAIVHATNCYSYGNGNII